MGEGSEVDARGVPERALGRAFDGVDDEGT